MNAEIRERQLAALKEFNVDALVSLTPETVAYASGVSVPSQSIIRRRHAICVFSRDVEPSMIVVDIEDNFVRASTSITDVRSYNEFTQDPMELLSGALVERRLASGRIAIELDYLPARDFEVLKELLPKAEFVKAEPIFDRIKMIKTKEEIDLLRHLGQAAEISVKEAFGAVKAGMTETDIATGMAKGFLNRGGQRLAILAVGAGPRSSFLNCPPAGRALNRGDTVRVDLIGTINGYYCDLARTAVVGEPTSEQEAIWTKLVRAQESVIERIKPGVHTSDIYRFYSEMVTREGLTPINFVGHGLGLTLHEEPYVGRYGGCVLEEGMTLCVEPIHIIPDRMGFQIEDLVLVTSSGAECLTGSITGKKLLIISDS